MNVSVNGDIKTIEQAKEHLLHVDGVMMGRAVYANPWMLATADSEIYGKEDTAPKTRTELLEAFLPYVQKAQAEGCPLSILTKHLYGIFTGFPGGRKFRQILSEGAPKASDGAALIRLAMDAVEEI